MQAFRAALCAAEIVAGGASTSGRGALHAGVALHDRVTVFSRRPVGRPASVASSRTVVAGAARSAGVARSRASARLGRWPARARGAGLVVTAISWPIGQRDVGPEVRSRARGGAAAPPHPLLLTPLLVPLALSDTSSGLLSPPRRVSPPTHRGRLARSSAPPLSLCFAPPFGEFELTRFAPPPLPPFSSPGRGQLARMQGQLIHQQGQVERQGAKMKTDRQRILVRVGTRGGVWAPPY